jgi:uncharacterized protein YbaR (Trm112 family)/SAM-dependent methyltransferase
VITVREALLDFLRCPFCGGVFHLHASARLSEIDGSIESGVIWCECCAFPVVAGIPVLRSDETSRQTMQALEAGRHEDALFTLLGLDAARGDAFRALLGGDAVPTYRGAIAVLSPDPEGTYFIYRFSDPTFVMAEAVLGALGQEATALPGRVLDLCGGSGHLTRVISKSRVGQTVVLADMFFWKLWLAKRFTAPAAIAVCCDANQPLPFAKGTFPTVVLSDAFPYIWQKRLLAEEMLRQAGPDGTIVMPHLHSSLGWNYSAGMTLTPRSYADLFAALQPRLFPDEALFEQAVAGGGLDLSRPFSPEALGSVNSFTLIASRHERVFRRYPTPELAPVSGDLVVNPLYRVSRDGSSTVLTLRFPTQTYEDEFGECRRYLPDSLVIPADLTAPIVSPPAGLDVNELRRRRILIDAPRHYC